MHSVLSLSFFHRCKQSGLVRMFLVQLGFHQTPILKCTIMAKCKYYRVKMQSKEDATCLPCSREEEKLASSKLGVLSTPLGSVPIKYDACIYIRYKGKDGKSDTAHKH
jgi:hypothetical protein